MKYSLALLAAVAALGLFTPASAEARDHCERRFVGYTSTGCPIYSVYRIHGYDRWGHPYGSWVTEVSSDYRECEPPRAPSYGYDCGPRRPSLPLPPLPPLPRPGMGLSFFFGH